MWVARDKNGILKGHFSKPVRMECGCWRVQFLCTHVIYGDYQFPIPNDIFPELNNLTWEDEPIEVELIIKSNKK